jgi:hypothetical protein
MELLDFPEEILTEILSKLDQKNLHLTGALVCKRFLQLTRSPQLLKCVEYFDDYGDVSANKFQSLLVMLRCNKRLEKLVLVRLENWDVLAILKVVAPHGSLRHLEFCIDMESVWPVEDQDEWNEAFPQICATLTTLDCYCYVEEDNGFDCLAPLVNAKNMTTLKLEKLITSDTFRQMADNYTCLQNVDLYDFDCSENSDVAYFLEKQSKTLTSLNISTPTKNPLPAIFKCRNLKKLWLSYFLFSCDLNLNDLGSLSNLKSLCLRNIINSDLGNVIEAAKLQHLTEIELIFAFNLSDNDVSQIAQTYGQQV